MESHYGRPWWWLPNWPAHGENAPVWRLCCLLLLSHQSRRWLLTRSYRRENQTTPDAVLSRAVAKGDSPVTFHKLTTSNLTGQGSTINMRVRLDGSNASDQLVINGGQATGKTWLAFTNVGNSNLGVATSGQGIRVVDAQNGCHHRRRCVCPESPASGRRL